MQVNFLSAKELGRMQEAAKPATAKFADSGHAELVKELQADLAALRK